MALVDDVHPSLYVQQTEKKGIHFTVSTKINRCFLGVLSSQIIVLHKDFRVSPLEG